MTIATTARFAPAVPELLPKEGSELLPSTSILPLEIRIARTLAEVEDLRSIWSVWPGHRDSDIDFFVEFIRTRPAVIRPHVIVLYRDGVAEAMLVGRLERTKLNFRLGYLRTPGIPARMLIFSQGGARGCISDSNSTALVGSITTSLRRGEADLALLHQVDAASPLFQNVLAGTSFATRDHVAVPEPRYAMTVAKTVDELYAGFSRAVRHGVRQKKTRLLRQFAGRIRTECIQSSAELSRVIPHLEEVAAKTYQRGLGVGFTDTPEIRERLRFFAEKGWLRIYILYLDEKPCAFLTGTVHEGTFTSDFTGYDPMLRDHSPGTVVEITSMEDLCRLGVQQIEFGPGQAEYKRRFSNCQMMESNLHIFAATIKGVLLNALQTGTILVDRFLKAMLERTNLLAPLKNFWRRRLASSEPRVAFRNSAIVLPDKPRNPPEEELP